MTAKQEVLAIIKKLPPGASFEAISAEVETFAAVRKAQASAAAGRTISHEEVKRRFQVLSQKWKAK